MNDTKLEQLKRRYRYYGIHTDLTDQEKLMHKKLSCIDMINSIIAYHSRNVDVILKDTYLQSYIKELGIQTVRSLVEDQVTSVAYIRHDVYEDSDGCTYNSIGWKD